ncbi:DUF1553 domain-containing protein [Lignipirellula cremea]|uniref:LamG-like jellyroll fold domain-containing protein n=1 Tax=Lignipirellula cremea TaxID=2528010 RepID=A0A518DUR3_9BACT|nr:DUF1553 domain-containing protein [Lignipirellula cremea]QDU95564.1 hypothetical protein Pla8534_33800 [Lignipirellula cremea]
MHLSRSLACLVFGSLLSCCGPWSAGAEATPALPYDQIILSDNPVAYWRFDGEKPLQNLAKGAAGLATESVGAARLAKAGPQAGEYPLFTADNRGVELGGTRGYLKTTDPGEQSDLDFSLGDAITLEAWVNPRGLRDDQQVYIVGKGRTGNPGQVAANQNYALRLRAVDGQMRVSFLFRGEGTARDGGDEFHRWNSQEGFVADGRWRHVAVSYRFGDPGSIRGYINGQPTAGDWDIGGPTKAAPTVDNDDLWIGSSMGGKIDSTFSGFLDEVAIYRQALSPERMAARYQSNLKEPAVPDFSEAPRHAVLVEIVEDIPDAMQWNVVTPPPVEQFSQQAFALTDTPRKYNSHGVIIDRSNPFLVRSRTRKHFAGGEYDLLLRSRQAARLFIDGKLVAETKFLKPNGSGHEKVPELADPHAATYPLPPGHQETAVRVKLEPGEHHFRWECFVGGKNMRTEIGEPVVAFSHPGETPQVLTADAGDAEPFPLTTAAWEAFELGVRSQMLALNQRRRQEVSAEYSDYWSQRHDLARKELANWPDPQPPALADGMPANNAIDQFLAVPLKEAGVAPTALLEDDAFLRRVTLDTVGRIPTPAERTAFLKDPADTRRQLVIERLLENPEWADHWTSYWQDVLAENPGILKPSLNNTGPFRWWIYESMLDNKPLDRFVTDLVMMEGSRYGGGTAGFGMATENDVPMAAKAHTLATAFLGVEMKCARCHDAPFHPFSQEDLFSIAAMLDRKPITLPKSSTVPPPPAGGREPAIESSLAPGAKIMPVWVFTSLSASDLPAGLTRNPEDARSVLAASITSPQNERFAQVTVNRLWARYFGRGLVATPDDWHDTDASHPELLKFLARELVLSGYDMKHVSRLILQSHAYQRATADKGTDPALFAGPQRRRLSAEQLLDSLFVAADKQLYAEPLTLDPEGRRSVSTFLNLGTPHRAWEFTSMSNERDRPALALPMAQSLIDLMLAFGWRDSRPNPLTVREEPATVLQPLSIANGVAANRTVRLSDDHALTEVCLTDISLDALVDRLFVQILSRPPTASERELFMAELADGFENRRRLSEPKQPSNIIRYRNPVSWSNHLNFRATEIKQELERLTNEGDPPTRRLDPVWRVKVEDALWALINSPEFVFIP